MGKYRCMICDDKVACRAIDEELAKGMTGAAVSRLMTLRGFEVSASTVNEHKGHMMPMAPPGVAKTRKDLATLVRDKVQTAVENGEIDILDKMGQGAIKTGLAAEKIIDTRAARSDDKKLALALSMALLGGGPAGFLAPPDLIGEDDGVEDDDMIEGTAVVVE